MRYNDNEENDLLGEISDLLSVETITDVEVETPAKKVKDEIEFVLIPLDYQIFTTDNGKSDGKREIIDTYKCDRAKGIIPIGKAKMKAELMKKAFKNKTFFVEQTSSKILPKGRVTTVKSIVFETL